jgi:hypothetical protein
MSMANAPAWKLRDGSAAEIGEHSVAEMTRQKTNKRSIVIDSDEKGNKDFKHDLESAERRTGLHRTYATTKRGHYRLFGEKSQENSFGGPKIFSSLA